MPQNHLKGQSSPYLLQHVHNPVDWWPWAPETLQRAISENKPIILSIGYSACHWCHVMEHESFENEQIASIMNQYFVCIKVDREERPDVDAIYMDALQNMGIAGGWPLNVFLMPNLKPFYGGTYFKPNQWAHICQSIATAFQNQFDEISISAENFANSLNISEIEKYNLHSVSQKIGKKDIDKTIDSLLEKVDRVWGGLDKAPKFPMPSIWLYLLEIRETQSADIQESIDRAINLTLNKMACGGIFDHIGGGFARYSVDGRWFCPHFEKMLYDNGQLMELYAKAYAVYKNPLYLEVTQQCIYWLKTEMLDVSGMFYAAQDADSEGVEGKYYTWSQSEIESILGEKSAKFNEAYHVTPAGNWAEEEINILWKKNAELNENFQVEIAKLLEYRNLRVKPGLDNKIIIAWNALAISGLVAIYENADQSEALQLAEYCATALLKNCYKHEQLYRCFTEKKVSISGFLEDYSCSIKSLIDLYSSTYSENWLAWAETLTLEAIYKFYDTNEGFFDMAEPSKELIAQKKEIFDNVIPASNSIMAHNLWHLGILISRHDFCELAEAICAKMSKLILINSDYLSNWARLTHQMMQPKKEVIISGPDSYEFAKVLKTKFVNNNLYILANTEHSSLPLFADRNSQNNDTKIFVCVNNTCQLPVNNVDAACRLIIESGVI